MREIGPGGWGHDVSLQRDTSTGDLVTYHIQSEADLLSSAGRRDASRIRHDSCPVRARIIKEGEWPKVGTAVDRACGAKIGTARIWGMHFTCT